jgi:hypothetical protein
MCIIYTKTKQKTNNTFLSTKPLWYTTVRVFHYFYSSEHLHVHAGTNHAS